MAQCPNCHNDVKAGERFCGNCGARLESTVPPPAQPETTSEPPQRTGKETIILPKLTDLGLTPPPAPPAQPQPSTDATLLAGPSAPEPARPASDATLIGAAPGLPPSPPPTPNAPPIGGGAYTGAGLPTAPAMPAPAAKSGSNVWKILAIIAGIGVVACVALALGVYYFVVQPVSRSVNTGLATANASLSNGAFATINASLETVAAVPTFAPISTLEPDATDLPRPTAAAGDAEAVLYSENFDNPKRNDFDEGDSDNSTYAFVDGAYAITVKTANWISWAPLKGDYGDASISVDTTLKGPKKSGASLLFHYQDKANFYLFTVAADGGYSLDVYKSDKPESLLEGADTSAIKGPGELNSLRVETVGDTIRLFVNDKLLDEISDSTFRRGKAAIAVNTFDDPNVTVTFDNVVIRGVK
jgi:hypothetical protein